MSIFAIGCPVCRGKMYLDKPDVITKSRIRAMRQRKTHCPCQCCGADIECEWRYEAHADSSPTGERRPCLYLKIPEPEKQRAKFKGTPSPFAPRAGIGVPGVNATLEPKPPEPPEDPASATV